MKHLIFTIKYLPFYLIAWLPFPILYLLSDGLYLLTFYLLRYRRDVVRSNLKMAFPHWKDRERAKVERAFYRHFCDMLLETIKLLTISEKDMDERIKLLNTSLISEMGRKGQSIVFYTSHQGNWEWLTSLSARLDHKIITLYKPLKSSYMDQLMHHIRTRFGNTLITKRKGYRSLIKYLGKEELVGSCIIGDQRVALKHSSSYEVLFLNIKTRFLSGAEEIARRTTQAVIFPQMTKVARGRYEVEFIAIPWDADTREGDVTRSYARLLGEAISQNPELWLWTHRRWK